MRSRWTKPADWREPEQQILRDGTEDTVPFSLFVFRCAETEIEGERVGPTTLAATIVPLSEPAVSGELVANEPDGWIAVPAVIGPSGDPVLELFGRHGFVTIEGEVRLDVSENDEGYAARLTIETEGGRIRATASVEDSSATFGSTTGLAGTGRERIGAATGPEEATRHSEGTATVATTGETALSGLAFPEMPPSVFLDREFTWTFDFLSRGRDERSEDALPDIRWSDNERSAGQLEDGILALDLEVLRGRWRPYGEEGGAVAVLAFAEAGEAPQVPGPMARVPPGTEVAVRITNPLDAELEIQGLSGRLRPEFEGPDRRVHPGEELPSFLIAPGATRTVRFTARNPGTYLYRGSLPESPTAAEPFEDNLLQGAFIVDDPRSTPPGPEKVMVIQDFFGDSTPQGFPDVGQEILTINGRPWPHTERLNYGMEDEITWRVINASTLVHPMHLHGFFYEILSRGDLYRDTIYRPLQVRQAVTEHMNPFTTMKLRWSPDRPGGWIFHCHLTNHVFPNPGLEGDLPTFTERAITLAREDGSHDPGEPVTHSMGGLVTGVYVEPPDGWTPVEPEGEPIRLHVREDSVAGYVLPRFGYAVGQPGEPPPPDRVPFPGDPLILEGGPPAAVRVVNETDEPTTTHWHGLEVESLYDGVAGVTGYPEHRTPPIMPGDSFEVALQSDRPGTYIYHTHMADLRQQGAGLYGPLLVLPEGETWDPSTDQVYIVGMGLGETERLSGRLYLNGQREPDPRPMTVGEEYRLRLINITPMSGNLVFRLVRDGYPVKWRPLAQDAWTVPPHRRDLTPARQWVSVGETYDVLFTPREPGELRLEVRNEEVGGQLVVTQPIEVQGRTPLDLPTPEDWQAAAPFPLTRYIPAELGVGGVAKLRFPPGMFDPESEQYFSFVMGWWVEEGPQLDGTGVSTLLEAYYEGVADREDDPAAEVAPVRVTLQGGNGAPDHPFVYTVEAHDPFAAHGPVTAGVRAYVPGCGSEGGQGVYFEVSPQPEDHPIWKTLAGVRQGARC